MRKVHLPWMRRHIGTLRHEAEVAEITLIDDLPEIGFGDAVDLHRLAVVHEIEQRGERAAQRHAAATSMTDVEDALHLPVEGFLVVEIGVAPIERMARGSVEIAFARCHDVFGC